MSAPLLVSAAQTATWDAASPKTVNVTVQAGDIIVVCGASENSIYPMATPTGGGLTYAPKGQIVTAGFCATYVWTATAVGNATFAVTVDITSGSGHFGAEVYVFRGSAGVGASAAGNFNPAAPSVSLATTAPNSAVVAFNSDGVPVDGSSRTWRTVNGITPSAGNGLEKLYQKDSTSYATYSAYWNDAGPAGGNTYGLTAPNNQGYAIIAVEIKGSAPPATGVAGWRPDVAVQAAFNADPNDPTAVPSWTDLTTRFRTAKNVTRGRQYELDTNQGAQPVLSFLDQDEYLNPANPNSPYAPNVVPYRQLLWQAMWPNTTGLTPILNSNPYFETTASPWTAVGGTVARSTAQFHEGAASLLLTPDGVSTSNEARSENVAVQGNASYTATAWLFCAVARSVNLGIIWRDSGGTILGGPTTTVSVAANTWTFLQFSATAPALTVTAQLKASMSGTPPASNLLYVDEAKFQATPASNLLNTRYGANPILGTVNGYDPTFESYVAGSRVPWIKAVGGTNPAVSTGSPHAGTKALNWPIAAGATPQGVSLAVPCIPGRQYTTSIWVSQGAANTQRIGLTSQSLAVDAFNRTASNGWGTADLGGAWSVGGASNAEFSTSGGAAFQSVGSVGVLRASFIGSGIDDVTVTAKATIPVVAVGGPINARVVLRRVDINNFYMLEARFNVDNTISVNIWKVVGGTSTQIGAATASFTYAANTSVWLQFTANGPNLSGVCWLDGSSAAFGTTVSATDTALTAGAAVGVHSALNSLNSNSLPVVIAWSHFTAVGTVYGTSTTAVPSYQQLAITFTATQPVHTVQLATSGTVVDSSATVDDIQHEQGSSASAFTTSGPTIYGVFRGYVERWPSRWDYMGFLGEADLTCVDAFGPQNLIGLWTEYRNSVLAKNPNYYWSLSEPQDAKTFAEASGNNGPSLQRLDSSFGQGATFAAGTQTNIVGDPSGTGLAASAVTGTPQPPASVAQAGYNNNRGTISIGGTGPTVAYSAAVWVAHSNLYPWGGGPQQRGVVIGNASGFLILSIDGLDSPNKFGAGNPLAARANDIWADGKLHLVVVNVSVSGGLVTVTTYVDGAQVATANFSSGGPYVGTFVEVGGYVFLSTSSFLNTNPSLPDGVYAHLAIWNRNLTPAEITDLWNAGKGYVGETSGARVTRYLGYGWTGPTSVDAGQSVMGASTLTAGSSLLAATQDVATTENGNYWADKDGNTTFAARTRRYLATTSLYTFGEREDLGEYPYLGDIAFDFDPTLVYNVVAIENAGGVTAVTTDPASRRAYFPRSYQRQVNVLNNNEAIDASTYLLNQHAQPHLRVQSIVLDPASNPALWPVVLSLEVGQRVTVKRRAKAANNGVGLTIAADFFVEQISIEQVDMRAGMWTYRLYLSPVDISQVGVLDDGGLGRLATAGAQLVNAISAGAASATVSSLTGEDLFITGGSFQATIDSEIVQVTAVAPIGFDSFGRTVFNTWGNAPSGQAWGASGGNNSDYQTDGTRGIMGHPSVNVPHTQLLPLGVKDFDIRVVLDTGAALTPAGGPLASNVDARVYASGGDNCYRLVVRWEPTATASLELYKVVAGVVTSLGGARTQIPGVNGNSQLAAHFQVIGNLVRGKVWKNGTTEPPSWLQSFTDSGVTAAGDFRLGSVREVGNTDAGTQFRFYNLAVNPQVFTITRPTDGTASAHSAGAPVQTYQPFVLAY